MLELDALVERANELEPLPATVSRLASVVSSDDSSVRDVSEIVSFDPKLTAALIRYANSAATAAGRGAVETVDAAVTRLGMGVVLEVATANSVRAKLQAALPEFDMSAGALWRHAVATALAAEWLGRVRRGVVPPETFTAALLHDVGKLVLARFLDRDLLDYLERARREGGRSPLEAEREILGVHHGELGGLICQHWDLSENICRGVTHHHDPEAGFATICDAVHVANLVAHYVEGTPEGAERGGPLPDVERGSLDRLSLDVNLLRDLCTNVRDNLGEVLQRFGA